MRNPGSSQDWFLVVLAENSIRWLVCLLGNVDLNLLGMGTPEEVDREVCELIRDLAPGGGYIVTSGNSLVGYLKEENVRALSEAVQRYGALYPAGKA